MKVISKRGYHGATTILIAKEAKVSQGIIFHYFKTKEDLFFSILENGSRKFREEIEKNISSEVNALKRIEKIALTYCEMIEKQEDFFGILIKQVGGSGLNIEKINKLGMTESVKLLREIFEEGTKQGVIRRINLDVATD